MVEFLIFLRDALVAMLLSWVGMDGGDEVQKEHVDKDEPVKTIDFEERSAS